MDKVLNPQNITSVIKRVKENYKTVVLVGGCFDIIHLGHIMFLKSAKNEGNVLILLLESDENIRKRKGEGRPINSQSERINTLSKLEIVDFIVPLTGVTKNEEYDKLMIQIKPDIVAMTDGDKDIEQRTKQCEMVGAKLKLVIKKMDGLSTTAFINEIKK